MMTGIFQRVFVKGISFSFSIGNGDNVVFLGGTVSTVLHHLLQHSVKLIKKSTPYAVCKQETEREEVSRNSRALAVKASATMCDDTATAT